MKNKGLVTAIIVFLLLFFTSTVYAAVGSSFSFSGYAARTATLDIRIVNPAIISPRSGETASVSDVLNDYKTLSINVSLTEPGDVRYITFQIQNIGTLTANLGELITVDPDINSGVIVTWPDIGNTNIFPGTTTQTYQIKVEWDINNIYALSGAVQFSATVNFD